MMELKQRLSKSLASRLFQPLYAGRGDASPLAARAPSAPWQIMARVDHPDPVQANKQALEDLEGGASGLMLFIEFFVDKIPGLDSLWDAIHTFVRIPAGAALAGAVFGGDQASWVTAAALMGGTLAATSHAAKLTTRASANTSPEPFSNIALSLLGDSAVPLMLWLSWTHPVVALVALAAIVVVSIVVVVILWRFLAGLIRRMRGGYVAAVD